MSKRRKKISAGRPRPRRTSSVGGRRGHSAASTRLVPFTALSEAQWEAIRATRNDWPDGIDWRGKIEEAGRQLWEVRAERRAWLERLRERPTKERKKVETVLLLTRQLQNAWLNSSLDDTDLPDPGVKLREQRAEVWLYNYGTFVTPYAGQSDPVQDNLQWQLMSIWAEAGGELSYSRKKDDPGTPYTPLIDFLTLTLEAIIGETFLPSGIAKMIDRLRPDIANARGMYQRRRGGRLA
jgi:hypothetical protein